MTRILLVEDKMAIRLTISAVLEEEGFDIECASDGLEAIKMVNDGGGSGFSLIISDIMMPNLNGIEFVTGLRAVNDQTPVLFISGGGYNMGAEDMLNAAGKISDGVLKKPFSNQDLVGKVKNSLRKKRLIKRGDGACLMKI
jgi:DNA-binding response OmpR family regulator